MDEKVADGSEAEPKGVCKDRWCGTGEPPQWMLRSAHPDATKQEEMTAEGVGQQPVVVMKQGNACGAKGHNRAPFGY